MARTVYYHNTSQEMCSGFVLFCAFMAVTSSHFIVGTSQMAGQWTVCSTDFQCHKQTSKVRHTGPFVGRINWRLIYSLHKGLVMPRTFPCNDAIMLISLIIENRYSCPPGLLHSHRRNRTIAPVVQQLWTLWINRPLQSTHDCSIYTKLGKTNSYS